MGWLDLKRDFFGRKLLGRRMKRSSSGERLRQARLQIANDLIPFLINRLNKDNILKES